MTNVDAWDSFELALPHPYLTRYRVARTHRHPATPYQLQQQNPDDHDKRQATLPKPLHNPDVSFSSLLKADEELPENNNTPWARARRSLSSTIEWKGSQPPMVGQIWLIIYFVFSLSPEQEHFRLFLNGPQKDAIRQDLKTVGLAIEHPEKPGESTQVYTELLVLRSLFWQGAGSPFGSRSVWLAQPSRLKSSGDSRTSYLPLPLDYTFSNKFPASQVCARHPIRPAKPTPGSTVYSRYIPHLKENFSMVALDYENPEHLQLFHNWQNDPRVAAGWNETGTLDQHREYLRKLHNDQHTLTLLAAFDDVFFSYHEFYWAKEDNLGAYYNAGDYDRGRHSLVGDARYRGPHRVAAWWSSIIHYLFLDDPRTTTVVGEPRPTKSHILAYDFSNGFNIEHFVDFPHKRSVLVRVERERFFQIVPLNWDAKELADASKRSSLPRGSKL